MATSVAFLSIAFRNVVRNRQKTITSVLGIILAVTLIFGETISIEHQSGAVLQHEMEEQNYHFSMYGWQNSLPSAGSLKSALHDLMNVSGIERYSIRIDGNLVVYQDGGGGPSGYREFDPVIHFPGLNSSNASYHNPHGSYGSSLVKEAPNAPPRGSILLSTLLRDQYDLNLGQSLTLTFSDIEFDYYGTGQHVIITQHFLTRNFTIGGFWDSYRYQWYDEPWYDEPWYDPLGSQPTNVWFNGDDYLDLYDDINTGLNNSTRMKSNFQYYSVLDPGTYRNTNLIKAKENAGKIEQDLRDVIEDVRITHDVDGINLNSNYKDAFDDTDDYFTDVKWLLVALSVPIVLFGLYLGYLGLDLFLSERRREIGMLKARGATNRQLMTLLTTESLFVGAFAGAVGIVFGGYGSRLIIYFTQAGSYVDLAWYDPGFSFGSFLSAILLGMVLMLGSAAHLFRRITKLEAGELLSKYSTKQEKPYNASRDLKILAFSAVCLVAIAFRDSLDDIANSSDNILLSFVLGFFVYIVVPIMVVSAPYIIIVIGVRLATRGQKSIFIRLAEIAERLTGELGYLIKRGIATGNRRIVNLTTVLSVLFAFLVLVSTFTFAQQELEERTIRTEVGSDIQVIFNSRLSVNDTLEFEGNISTIEGIETVIPIFQTSAELNFGDLNKTNNEKYWDGNQEITIYIANCSAYRDIAFFDGSLFDEGSKNDIRSLRDGGVILSSDASDRHDLKRGDDVLLIDTLWNWSAEPPTSTAIVFGGQDVLGVMTALSGLYNSRMMGAGGHWMLMDSLVYFTMLNGLDEDDRRSWESDHRLTSQITLIGTSKDLDPEDLETFIDEIGTFDVDKVRSSIREVDTILSEPTSESSVLVLRTELGVLVFISLIASATIVFISSFEKVRERAAIMLRGTTSRQLYALEFGEASVILVYSLVVGILTGYLAGVVWIYVFNVFEDLDVIQRSYAPSFSMFPIIGIMVGIFLAAVAVSTIRLRKFDLIKFVRWG